MKIINRYVLKEVRLPILFGISIFTFVFLIDILVQLMGNILVNGVAIIDVLRILSFYLPPILSQTIPMGFFLGVMITYSKLTSTSEVTAMRSIGMSVNDIIKPIFLLALGIVAFIFYLQESIIPRSFVKLEEVSRRIAYENPNVQLKENMYINDIDEYSIYIDKVDKNSGKAKNIIIFKESDGDPFATVLTSRETNWYDASMVLSDAHFYQFDEDGKEKLHGDFKEQKIPISSFFKDVEVKVDAIEGKSIGTLVKELDNPAENIVEEAEEDEVSWETLYKIEINKKLALPLSTIFLGILGVLFSIGHHRSGKSVSYGIALGVIFTYITLLNVGVVIAKREVVSPLVALWTPNLILALFTGYSYLKKAGKN